MQTVRVAILKYVFLMVITKINGYMIVRFDNLKEEQLVSDVINTLKENVDNNLKSRKNIDSNGYVNRQLVKRILPHGYEVKNYEYDHKFKTLYKPLVRIHRNKPNTISGENGNRYEVKFVLDNDNYKDIVDLAKDDILIEPFTTNKAEVTYFQPDKDLKYITNDNKNTIFDHLKLNIHKIVDSVEKLEDKTTDIEKSFDKIDPYELELHGSLKQLLRQQTENLTNNNTYQWDSEKLNKLSNHIKQLSLDKESNEKDKDSSNKPNESNKKRLEWLSAEGELDFKLTKLKKYNSTNKPNLMKPNSISRNVFREGNAITDRHNKKSDLNGMFGPIGQLYSKKLKKNHANRINTRDYHKKVNHHGHELPTSLKRQVLKLLKNKKFQGNRNLFGPKGRKPKLTQGKDPINVIKLLLRNTDKTEQTKNIKSDKYTLLNEMFKLKANQENEEAMAKILKSNANTGLRENLLGHELKTTEKPERWLPSYPFWNYWTYEKTIHQDECKDPLVLYGRICIEPIA